MNACEKKERNAVREVCVWVGWEGEKVYVCVCVYFSGLLIFVCNVR